MHELMMIIYDDDNNDNDKSFQWNSSPTKSIKDTHREKVPSNTTPALTESMNMDLGSWYFKSTL